MRSCSRCGATYAAGTQFCPKDGTATIEAPSGPNVDPFVEKMVGNFRLVRKLGAGAMGSVYEGVNKLVGIRVAVKILGGELAVDTALVERFFAEAKALNQIAHENIVRVIDLGEHPEGFYYCVMELLEGETLAVAMRNGPLPLERGLTLLAQAFDALGAAHAKGIVHRDLKPTNMMIVRHPVSGAEVLKLVDFGVAKLQRNLQGTATVSGMIIGTPAYMSPEQAAGRVQDVDGRSDLYCMGLVAYEVFTGRHPFQGRAIGELIAAQLTEMPAPPLSLANIPKRLDALLFRLLQKSREARPSSAESVAVELRAILQDSAAPTLFAVDFPAAAFPVDVPPPPPPTPPPPTLPPPMRPMADVFNAPPPEPPLQLAFERTPTPAPVLIPSRQEPPSQERKPAIPRAMKTPLPTPKKPRQLVRRPFLYALVAIAVLFGITFRKIVDVEPLVGAGATLLGLRPPSSSGNTAMPALDGAAAAFKAAPVLSDCRRPFNELRGQVLSSKEEDLRQQLAADVVAWNRLEECLRVHEKELSSESAWVAPYLHGVAAYGVAHALDRLTPAAKIIALTVRDEDNGTNPFDATFFANRATDYFNEARPDAPMIHRGLSDAFLRALDRIRLRAGTAENK